MSNYRKLEGVDIIIGLCLQVLRYANNRGLSTDDISLFIHPDLADSLELGDTLWVEYEDLKGAIPVVRDDVLCSERELESGGYESAIYIGDSQWRARFLGSRVVGMKEGIEDILNEAPIARISLLDIYDDLPEDEQELLGPHAYRIGQWRKAERVLELVPENARRYYIAQYSVGPGEHIHGTFGKQPFTFIGFICCSCDRWMITGHENNCPMNELMPPDFDYRAAVKLVEAVEGG